jgi:epoxide hydrolase-like predicted phosphatase
MEKILAIIFDWGGVLIEDPAPGLVKYCAKALGVGEAQYKRAYNICMDEFQTGRVTEERFWANMTSHLNARLGKACRRSRVLMPKVDSLWGDAFAAVYVPRPELFTLAARLRETRCKIALLSNTEKPAVEFFHKQKYDVFDVAVFSCLEGTKKPERKVYEIILDRLGTSPGQTLFIDDRQDYIDGAEHAGMKTILFKDVGRLKKDLSKFFSNLV